jgi:hypothetical protein
MKGARKLQGASFCSSRFLFFLPLLTVTLADLQRPRSTRPSSSTTVYNRLALRNTGSSFSPDFSGGFSVCPTCNSPERWRAESP